MLTPGTPLELLCDARGTPAPNITWHKDGQALSGPEDGKGARRVLQVEGVQVRLPSCHGTMLRRGGEGPSSTQQSSVNSPFVWGVRM